MFLGPLRREEYNGFIQPDNKTHQYIAASTGIVGALPKHADQYPGR